MRRGRVFLPGTLLLARVVVVVVVGVVVVRGILYVYQPKGDPLPLLPTTTTTIIPSSTCVKK